MHAFTARVIDTSGHKSANTVTARGLSPGLSAPVRLTGCLCEQFGLAGPVASLSAGPGTSRRGGGAVLFRGYSPDALERGAERERAAVADLPRDRTDGRVGLAQQISS
jgi:hypothetical protein